MDYATRQLVRDALSALGVRRLVLGIHDAAFPMHADEDVGHGSPASRGAAELFRFASSLGFDAIQLGPQGATAPGNASPYDATLFSRSPTAISLATLTERGWGSLVHPDLLEKLVRERPGGGERVCHAYAHAATGRALREAAGGFRALRASGPRGAASELVARFEAFRAANAEWLARDATYEVLQARHGGHPWWEWTSAAERDLFGHAPEVDAAAEARLRALLSDHAEAIEEYAIGQFLAHEQHRLVRERARALGLALFGDLQVGLSARDWWGARSFTLEEWRMGAPPSRTDPGGQAWGFPVLDPEYVAPDARGIDGPALRFFRARVQKLASEFDGLRVDHPHGLVCPWVYRAGPDPDRAVRDGARLFESPALLDHPELARFAIARPEQLDRSVPRHGDGWVTNLDEEQVTRYSVLFDVVMESVGVRADVACEILSTQPYPLERVVDRYGLGRFRITQKLDLGSPGDVYRGENARPSDWIMLGNHDTPPIWAVAERWVAAGSGRRHAEHLASRLLAHGEDREAWMREVAVDARALAQARFAELFVGPARNVFVYFTDLFGWREPYNVPGIVSERNWTGRLLPGFEEAYARAVASGRALDVPRAVARAMRARGPLFVSAHRDLVSRLESRAAR